MGDDEFVGQFEACTLQFDQWTHREHVKVAFAYLSRHPFDAALDLMRGGVKRCNTANNVSEGPTSGYNETTTVAFMRLIDATMKAYGETFPAPDADSFCDTHPQLLSKHILRLFYFPQRRMHPEAKVRFIEPDLAPLPVLRESADSHHGERGDRGANESGPGSTAGPPE